MGLGYRTQGRRGPGFRRLFRPLPPKPILTIPLLSPALLTSFELGRLERKRGIGGPKEKEQKEGERKGREGVARSGEKLLFQNFFFFPPPRALRIRGIMAPGGEDGAGKERGGEDDDEDYWGDGGRR